MIVTVTRGGQRPHGIEIKFSEKPDEATRRELSDAWFSFSFKSALWYGPENCLPEKYKALLDAGPEHLDDEGVEEVKEEPHEPKPSVQTPTVGYPPPTTGPKNDVVELCIMPALNTYVWQGNRFPNSLPWVSDGRLLLHRNMLSEHGRTEFDAPYNIETKPEFIAALLKRCGAVTDPGSGYVTVAKAFGVSVNGTPLPWGVFASATGQVVAFDVAQWQALTNHFADSHTAISIRDDRSPIVLRHGPSMMGCMLPHTASFIRTVFDAVLPLARAAATDKATPDTKSAAPAAPAPAGKPLSLAALKRRLTLGTALVCVAMPGVPVCRLPREIVKVQRNAVAMTGDGRDGKVYTDDAPTWLDFAKGDTAVETPTGFRITSVHGTLAYDWVTAAPSNTEDSATVTFRREQRVLASLSHDTPIDLDVLIAQTGLPPEQVLATLMVLEIRRLVRQLPGKKFITDAPTPGMQYRITGGPKDTCLSNGNTWKDSEVKPSGLAALKPKASDAPPWKGKVRDAFLAALDTKSDEECEPWWEAFDIRTCDFETWYRDVMADALKSETDWQVLQECAEECEPNEPALAANLNAKADAILAERSATWKAVCHSASAACTPKPSNVVPLRPTPPAPHRPGGDLALAQLKQTGARVRERLAALMAKGV